MSAYSALVLAANAGLDRLGGRHGLTRAGARALLSELGLLGSRRRDDLFNLAPDLSALFDDPAARRENDRFFAPDSIGFAEEVLIHWPYSGYHGTGCCICMSGYGYFYPWDAEALRSRVLVHPKLVRLREVLETRFGGWFRFPRGQADLRRRLLEGKGGWVWLASESL